MVNSRPSRSRRVPNFSLADIQAAARAKRIRFDYNAERKRRALGIGIDEAIDCICVIKPSDFYKPVTLNDGTLADVYRPKLEYYCEVYDHYRNEVMYIKLNLTSDGTLVMSFKPKDNHD